MMDLGLKGRTGRPISKNSLAFILHNPFYMGLIRIERTGETFEGRHQPLVTKALFDRVQGILSGRTGYAQNTHDFVFRRLIQCAACGRSLVGERQKGHVYYRCHTTSCRGTSMRESDVLDHMRELLRLVALSQEELADLRALATSSDEEAKREEAAQREALQLAQGRCADRLTRLTDAFLDAAIDKETFEARKAALLEEKRSILDRLERQHDEPSTDPLEKLELAQTAYLSLDSELDPEKREAVLLTTSNLVADGKTPGFALRFPFDEIAKWRISQCGPPFRVESRNGGTLFVPLSSRSPHSPKRPCTARLFSKLWPERVDAHGGVAYSLAPSVPEHQAPADL